MPYLIQGNAQQLAKAFDVNWLFAPSSKADGAHHIMLDLPRTFFLGSQEDAHYFVECWTKKSEEETYAQGDMFAGNLVHFLGQYGLLKEEDEDIEDYSVNYGRISFAYVNTKKELCGLTLHYRKDDPSQWLITWAKNTTLPPAQRQVILLASFSLCIPVIKAKESSSLFMVDKLHNALLRQIDNPFIKEALEYFLTAKQDEIESKFSLISQVMRTIKLDNPNLIEDPVNLKRISAKQLFAKNRTLELMQRYKINLTFKMLTECVNLESDFCKIMDTVVLDENETVNPCLLTMYLHFYEQGVLKEYRELLEEHFIKKTHQGIIWNEKQIQLIPFLVKNYKMALIQQILANPAYYSAVTELVALNLTHDIPKFFANSVKLTELDFLEKISNKDLKQLCLIFWIKGSLTFEEYQIIINAGETYPLLAETLVALDKEGGTSIEDLKAWALNPQQHLQQSIIYHFGQDYAVNKAVLNKLSVKELERLNQSFLVLKKKRNVTAILFDEAARDNHQGQLIRLFLPVISSISDPLDQDALIDLLYEGVRKGPISLSKAIASLSKDSPLYQAARILQDRFLCAKQIQMLGLKNEFMEFVAVSQDKRADKLRHLILNVVKQCNEIDEHILRSNVDPKHIKEWSALEQQYRKTLYELAYETIQNPLYEYKPILRETQNKILNAVDPEITSWVQKALIIIANAFIFVLTAGFANKHKYEQTGNYWFFNQTAAGEKIRAIERDFCIEIGGNSSFKN